MKKNKYFYITIAISAIIVTITGIQGVSQISNRRKDNEKYIAANTVLRNQQATQQEIKEVIKELEDLEKKYKDVPSIYMDKANAYHKLGEFKKSLKEMEKYFLLEDTKKDSPTTIYLYAKLAYLSGEIEQSKIAMNKAVELGILNQQISQADKEFIEKVIKE